MGWDGMGWDGMGWDGGGGVTDNEWEQVHRLGGWMVHVRCVHP